MLSIKKNMLTKIIQKCEKNMLKLHLLIILHLMKRKECILNRQIHNIYIKYIS